MNQVECPIIVLLCFSGMEQLSTTEDVNKTVNAFIGGRSSRHAADGDTTNSEGGKTVLTTGEGADVVTRIVRGHTMMASARSHPSVGIRLEGLRNTTKT
jgi:hypothetical protein